MASSVIHMCVASEVNKRLKRDNDLVLLGSIAPDISKHLGKTKFESHFLFDDTEVPSIQAFLEKYKKSLTDDFVLGYYIHLYTDYIWFKYFYIDFLENGDLYLLDGTKVEATELSIKEYFYNDYTTLNKILIEEYELDLKIFENKIPKLKNIIKEIPMNQLQLIVDKTNAIIKKANETKSYVFDAERIYKFINTSVEAIITNLKDIGYIKN